MWFTLLDTLYSRSKVIALRESRSRPNAGIVTVATEGFNQDGVVVCSFTRTLLVYKRDHAPRPPVPRPAEAPR